MPKLSPREYGIFAFICQYTRDHSKSPTRKEIGNAFYITPQGADYHIRKLTKKGFLHLTDHRRRNIRLKKDYYRRQISLFD